ncbi:hypothetical protein LOD99_4191 [Oopsacas minuta]|uniref:Uncharacterized protein n=1 Tax=Oopsacas minuta TaxID=111878 RepID=A0AAV7JWI8_9METZ|nr:hypothetical protein LOD99_4191 [Oopsacas minuta]
MSSSLDTSETDIIQILIHISKPYATNTSTATLGPWIGSQAAQSTQLTPSVKQRREDRPGTRKRSGVQSQNRVYTFQHFSDRYQYIQAYNDEHTAKNQSNPFSTRYIAIPQTFISLPHPDCNRAQLRYVEDQNKYPIPIALGKTNNCKTNSTPNLCLLPGDGATQLPPIEVQRNPSARQEKRFVHPKSIVYIDPTRSTKANTFTDSALNILSNSFDVLRCKPQFDSKFKGRLTNQADSINSKQTCRKLEKLLVTCENDALNLENMIQNLCKSIPSVKLELKQEETSSDKLAKKRIKDNPSLTKEVFYEPSAEQINDSLLNQLAYDCNKVDYDSPLDLQFDGRIYHTDLETFLQCLDQKLQNSSKASIEDLMNSIHVHTAASIINAKTVSQNSRSAIGSKKELRSKPRITGDESALGLGGKKIKVNMNIRKRKIY